MSNSIIFNSRQTNDLTSQHRSVPDPFDDPVSYLADLGIECELIAEIDHMPSAA
ncbi:MAG: hypothetical protein WB245_07220 [Acidimicrobiia bacterium]